MTSINNQISPNITHTQFKDASEQSYKRTTADQSQGGTQSSTFESMLGKPSHQQNAETLQGKAADKTVMDRSSEGSHEGDKTSNKFSQLLELLQKLVQLIQKLQAKPEMQQPVAEAEPPVNSGDVNPQISESETEDQSMPVEPDNDIGIGSPDALPLSSDTVDIAAEELDFPADPDDNANVIDEPISPIKDSSEPEVQSDADIVSLSKTQENVIERAIYTHNDEVTRDNSKPLISDLDGNGKISAGDMLTLVSNDGADTLSKPNELSQKEADGINRLVEKKEALLENKAKWEDSKAKINDSYSIMISTTPAGSGGLPGVTGDPELDALDIKQQYIVNGEIDDSHPTWDSATAFTIDDLFDVLEKNPDASASYDETLGFPTDIYTGNPSQDFELHAGMLSGAVNGEQGWGDSHGAVYTVHDIDPGNGVGFRGEKGETGF